MNALQPPDPVQTAAEQEKFNIQAAENQQALNMVSQVTPYGTLTYAPTNGIPIGGTSGSPGPGGIGGVGNAYPGMYTAYTQLSKPLRALFNLDVGNATESAKIAEALQRSVMQRAAYPEPLQPRRLAGLRSLRYGDAQFPTAESRLGKCTSIIKSIVTLS
jgi:hypothetical protein